MNGEKLNLIGKVVKSVTEEGISGCAVRTGKFVKKYGMKNPGVLWR